MIREKFLPTSGIHNFRDYGGYASRHGGTVKRGLLFRSGQHVEASEEDLAKVAQLDIRTIIDLRGESERTSYPCRRAPGFNPDVIAFEGETTSSPPHMDIDPDTTTAAYARRRMIGVYTRMPRNPAMIEMFTRFFRVLDEREGGSLVHCFAGKDRTGVAATLLLHVLGANRDDQMREFLLTNEAPTLHVLRQQSVPGMEARLGRKLDEDAVRALLEVHEDYLHTYIREIEADHGSLDRFIEGALGVDEAMQERLRGRFVA